jgi:hypothetical protein
MLLAAEALTKNAMTLIIVGTDLLFCLLVFRCKSSRALCVASIGLGINVIGLFIFGEFWSWIYSSNVFDVFWLQEAMAGTVTAMAVAAVTVVLGTGIPFLTR